MNRLIIIPLLMALISCQQSSEKIESDNQSDQIKLVSDSSSTQIDTTKIVSEQLEPAEEKSLDQDGISLTQTTVIVVQMDSAEIERAKKIDGEDNFYTGADDLMWYNAKLLEKMDSLKIPVLYDDKDTLDISTPNLTYNIIKDSTFTLYTDST